MNELLEIKILKTNGCSNNISVNLDNFPNHILRTWLTF